MSQQPAANGANSMNSATNGNSADRANSVDLGGKLEGVRYAFAMTPSLSAVAACNCPFEHSAATVIS